MMSCKYSNIKPVIMCNRPYRPRTLSGPNKGISLPTPLARNPLPTPKNSHAYDNLQQKKTKSKPPIHPRTLPNNFIPKPLYDRRYYLYFSWDPSLKEAREKYNVKQRPELQRKREKTAAKKKEEEIMARKEKTRFAQRKAAGAAQQPANKEAQAKTQTEPQPPVERQMPEEPTSLSF